MPVNRMSAATLRLLAAFLNDTEPIYGLELVRRIGSPSGTVYPILARLERAGVLEGLWESAEDPDSGRPRRRLYKLTGVGEATARAELDAHLRSLQLDRPRARWAPKAKGSPA